MGRLTNLNPSKALTEADLPGTMATDPEVTAAVTAAVTAHVNEADPHTQYLSRAEGDVRYRQSSVAFFSVAPLPTANAAVNSIAFSWNSVQPGLGIGEFCNYAGTGGGDAFNFFRMGGTEASPPSLSHRVARIDISGSYFQVSDRRLKKNFLPSPGLSEILALSPQRYQHYECLGFEDKKVKLGKNFLNKVGFVAQDVQKIIPEAVIPTTSEEELHSIDLGCLVACLVRAVQELQIQIDELR